MLSYLQVTDSVQELLAAVSQELIALALFTVSFIVFKYLNITGYQPNRKGKQTFPVDSSKKAAGSPPWKRPRGDFGAMQQNSQKRAQEAEAQIMKLLELREFTAALNAYRGFEREGVDRHFRSEEMYGGFIQSAVRVGKIDVVERMMRSMSRNRIVPSTDFWHTTLKMLSSRKHYSTCIMLFTTYGILLPNDKIIFSCLINAALESGAPEAASSMLTRYQQCNLEPSDHVTSFRTYVAIGDAAAAEKLFLQLGANLTPLMLNLVLLVCINAKQTKRAMSLLLQAHQFEAESSEKIVDTISYNTVIKGFVASGDVESALQSLQTLHAHNLRPDDVTLTSLLDVSLADKKVTDCLCQMLLEGAKSRAPETATCNLFMKGLIRENRLQKAVELYEGLRKCPGAQTSIVTYSILIKALVDAHDLERALLMLDDMAAAGVAPDEIIFTHLLEGCRLVGNHMLGERIFQDLVAANVKPSDYTLTMMVKLHGRCGQHEKAYNLVAEWQERFGMKPSVIHYTCVMSGCLRNKSHDLAWKAYELMEKDGVMPDETMMTTLLPAMVSSQKFDRVLHLARRALRRPGGIKVPSATLNAALAQMSANSKAQQDAVEMKLLMQTAGIPITNRTGNNSSFPQRRVAA